MRTPSLHRPFRCTPYVRAPGPHAARGALPPGSTVEALRDGHRRAFRSGIAAEGATSAILTAQACSSAAVAPAAAFQIPNAGFVSSFLASHSHAHGLSLVARASGTPYRNPEPARHAALRDDIQEHRVAGLADRGQSLPLGGPARIRTGTVTAATLAAAAGAESSAPARRVAGSLRASALDSAFHHPQRVARRRSRRSPRRTTRGARASASATARGGPCA